jgi:hypothetical protein
MAGTPVWLASLSRQSPLSGGRLATSIWSERLMSESTELLRRVLGPAGNPARERVFRMQVTLCVHRALTPDEVDSLPAYFHEDPPVDIAGGPVEIIWENEPGLPSTKPCHQPERISLDPRNRLLWFPADCGACAPCRARAAIGDLRDIRDQVGDLAR